MVFGFQFLFKHRLVGMLCDNFRKQKIGDQCLTCFLIVISVVDLLLLMMMYVVDGGDD